MMVLGVLGGRLMKLSVAFLLLTISAQAKDIRIAVASAPSAINGLTATDAAAARLLKLIAPALIQMDEDFHPQGLVAQSVTHQAYQTYNISLKEIYFHDGDLLNAKHLVELFDTIRAEGSTSPLKGYLADVASVEAVDDKNVRIELKQPSPWFFSALENIPVVKAFQPSIGTGAYRFVTQDDYGNVVLRRVDGDTFSFDVVKDPVVRVLKLERGEVDIVHGDLPVELYKYGLKKGLSGLSQPSASYSYLGVNLESGPLMDVRVRKALSFAIDRENIQKHLIGGYARPAQSLLLENHPAYWAAPLVYNPQKAQSLLAEAGYEDGLHLNLSVTTSPLALRQAQVLQQQLEKVGVDLQISSSEWGTFYGNIKKGNFQSYALSWVGRFQPDFFKFIFHSDMMPPDGANRGRFKSSGMDQVIDSLMGEVDDLKRNSLASQVQKMQHEQMIYIPLWRRHHLALFKQGVLYTISVDGGYSGLDQL